MPPSQDTPVPDSPGLTGLLFVEDVEGKPWHSFLMFNYSHSQKLE